LESTPSPAPPASICKRDGRLVPFEPDKISRALFAVTESLGRPDAFLARELADGILHFFAAETEGTTPTTALLSDSVVKVTRELGHPALAQAFADFEARRTGEPRSRREAARSTASDFLVPISLSSSPEAVLRSCLRAYSLQAVFSRDLIAAQADGLITLTGLDAPLQMSGGLLGPGTGTEATASSGLYLVEAIEHARQSFGQWLVFDGPEHNPALLEGGRARSTFVRELNIGLRATHLSAVINLNAAAPPPWAGTLAEGPLFAAHSPAVSFEQRAQVAADLLEDLPLSGSSAGCVRVDWHLGASDFAPGAEARLMQVARIGLATPFLTFAFDRPKKPIALAEGLNRGHAAALMTVGLHLPRLAELPGVTAASDLFLNKLGSLARLALSAAAQKREFLRRRDTGPISRGFLLDRARLVVAPIGLEAVARAYTGEAPCVSRASLDFARQVVERLHDVLRRDGPTYQLDACLDGVAAFTLEELPGPHDHIKNVAGLTPWDGTAPPKNQLRAASAWHAVADAGTATILLPEDRPLPPEEAADLLRHAWQHTEVVRLRFAQLPTRSNQLTN
jgi:hypothetical protein